MILIPINEVIKMTRFHKIIIYIIRVKNTVVRWVAVSPPPKAIHRVLITNGRKFDQEMAGTQNKGPYEGKMWRRVRRRRM